MRDSWTWTYIPSSQHIYVYIYTYTLLHTACLQWCMGQDWLLAWGTHGANRCLLWRCGDWLAHIYMYIDKYIYNIYTYIDVIYAIYKYIYIYIYI